MFTLSIKTDGAAFSDDSVGPDDCGREIGRRNEVARILREVADRMDNGDDCGLTMDYNGNKVGRFTLDHEE